MSRLPALLLRRSERPAPAGRPGPSAVVPRPRVAVGTQGRPAPVVRRGADALALLDVAPPSSGLNPGSLVLGFAVGAVVATRRRAR